MPRLVDHEVRRREITDAVRRVIIDGGLEAVTFQSVAAEAGMSVRLVQYYFGTKKDFLLATHRSVIEDAGARFLQRWNALGADATPRAAIRAVLIELLPLNEQRRGDIVVLGAFDWAAITGRGSTAQETFAPQALATVIAGQFERAGRADGFAPRLDAELVSLAIGGLAHGMLQGYLPAESAVELVDHLLDRMLGANTDDSTDPLRAS
ncbi:TetR/AcrR family transcriptional regulator [Nocardia lijiangensis]|uniref:TetR/AcrR family transcriptional regulator n=1 Tax=Nocardia lijiangensis TaxID=299618 RepID=UPI003D7527BC